MTKTIVSQVAFVAIFHLLLLTGCASTGWWKGKTDAGMAPGAVQLSSAQKADIHFALGRCAEQGGDTEKAIQAYTLAMELDGSRADVYHRLALLNDRRGEGETAHGLYLKALELVPEVAEIHCDLAYNCYLQERWDEAEQGLRGAIALKPDFARAHNNLGLLLGRTGRADEALWEFGRAGASEPQARTNLAFAMLLDGHVAVAEQQLNLAARQGTDQTYEQIARMRDMIQRSQSKHLAAPVTAPGPHQPVYRTVSHERP